MTVESYYVIAIATLSDWLKKSRQFFNQTKTNRTMCASFFPRFERVTGNCSELSLVGVIALALVFRQSFENRSILLHDAII